MADEGDSKATNLVLQLLSAIDNKILPRMDRQSIDIGIQAKALSDLPEIVDTKLNYMTSEYRVHRAEIDASTKEHRAEIDARVDKALAAGAADRALIIEHVIAIRSAMALASSHASTAARNSADAKAAATAARAAHEEHTGPHPLLDEFGHPTRPPHVHAEAESPTASAGGELVKGLLKGLPWPVRAFLLLIALIGSLIGGQAIEAKWHSFGGQAVERPSAPRELPAHHKD